MGTVRTKGTIGVNVAVTVAEGITAYLTIGDGSSPRWGRAVHAISIGCVVGTLTCAQVVGVFVRENPVVATHIC